MLGSKKQQADKPKNNNNKTTEAKLKTEDFWINGTYRGDFKSANSDFCHKVISGHSDDYI